MRTRKLGNTGWEVSMLALDTVELGVASSFGPGGSDTPNRDSASALLRHAFDHGVDLVETAPRSDEDEILLGEVLSERKETIRVATKVPARAEDLSIPSSLERLRRDRLDLCLLDRAGAGDLGGPVMEALLAERDAGRIERLGASVDGPGAALAALRHDAIDVVRLPFNLLDQRAAAEVFPEAERRGVGLIVGSALLEGVLTASRRSLPSRLDALSRATDRAERWTRRNRLDLTSGALRFCLSQREVGAVALAVRNVDELDRALEAAAAPELPRHKLSDASPLAVADENLIDPRRWNLS